MMPCDICEATKGELLLFEDPDAAVILNPQGAAPGHLLVVPKVHYAIMEQAPEDVMRQLFRVARLMASAMEKGIGCTDLDLVIANGPAAGQELPHLAIHLVPRGKGDGVKLGWEAASVDMDAAERRLKEALMQASSAASQKETSGQGIASSRRPIMRIP